MPAMFFGVAIGVAGLSQHANPLLWRRDGGVAPFYSLFGRDGASAPSANNQRLSFLAAQLEAMLKKLYLLGLEQRHGHHALSRHAVLEL